jgi:uncharacterized protein involved in exopolysaccharide biosynthesis
MNPITHPEPEVPAFPLETERSASKSSDRAYLVTRLLWEERKLVGKAVLRGTAIFLLVALLIPNTYESRTQLMPPESGSSTLGMLAALGSKVGMGGSALSLGADLLGLKSSGALFVGLLDSDTVKDDLINRFDLRKVYWTSTYRSARKKLARRTTLEEDKKSGVISITVEDRNPQRAAAMAKAYVDELNSLVASLNTGAAHRERVFLEERLKVVKADLDESSKAFSEFASKNTAIDIKEQGKAMVEAAAALQGQAIAAESELRGLEQIYTPENVRVRAVQARLAELKRQLAKLGGVSSLDPSVDPNSSEALYPSIRQLPLLGVGWADLYRRVKIDETVYEVLTQQYELARVEEAKEVPSVKVIDEAKPPEKRSGPLRTLIVLAGVLLSFCAAAMWVFSKQAWDGTDPHDPRKQLAEEIATTIGKKVRWERARDLTLKVVPRTFRNGNNGSDGHA